MSYGTYMHEIRSVSGNFPRVRGYPSSRKWFPEAVRLFEYFPIIIARYRTMQKFHLRDTKETYFGIPLGPDVLKTRRIHQGKADEKNILKNGAILCADHSIHFLHKSVRDRPAP